MRAPCRGKVHKCAPSPAKITRALSKGMADPVRARMTRSLHWAKETTFTCDDILATHRGTLSLLEHLRWGHCGTPTRQGSWLPLPSPDLMSSSASASASLRLEIIPRPAAGTPIDGVLKHAS